MTGTNTGLQKAQSGAITFGEQIGYTPEYVQLIKDTFARDATDNELQMFLEVCHQSKLNPFKKEIHFWKQAGKVIIHTGIDGYRLIADRTGRYAPGPPVKRELDDKGNHVSSTAYVRKRVGSDWFLIEETARMSEWTKDSPFWKGEKKGHQLDITAERHALRKAFPSSFPSALGATNPDGTPASDAALDTPEQAALREHLIENLLKIGKLFANDEQYKTLEATVRVSALPVLEERYSNALVKLREYTLGQIGTKLQGEAFSEFVTNAFVSGIDAAEADEFFTALDSLEGLTATPPAPATEPTEEAAAIDAEPVEEEAPAADTSGLDSATENLRAEVETMFAAATPSRQKDLIAGKPTIANMGLKELTALRKDLDVPF